MKKRAILLSVLTAVFMLALPMTFFLLRKVVPFPVFLALPYFVCPLFAVVAGALAGKDLRQLWCFALLPAMVSLGTFTYIMNLETALTFSICYLTLGIIALCMSALVRFYNRSKKQNQRR